METSMGITCNHGGCPLKDETIRNGVTPAVVVYDALSRLTCAGHYRLSGATWGEVSDKFTEQGISYDLHGNIQTLQRVAAGVLTDNLVYSYTGNQLTTLTENARSTSTADIYAPGSVPTGSYAYDGNGNMESDSRRGLTLEYNYLNLLREVKSGSTVKARYSYIRIKRMGSVIVLRMRGLKFEYS